MNFEALALSIAAAWLVMQFVEEIIKPFWDKFELDSFYLKYVAMAVGAVVGWFTGLNAFPVFATAPVVGQVLTSLAIGLGPSFIYNLVDKQPSLP